MNSYFTLRKKQKPENPDNDSQVSNKLASLEQGSEVNKENRSDFQSNGSIIIQVVQGSDNNRREPQLLHTPIVNRNAEQGLLVVGSPERKQTELKIQSDFNIVKGINHDHRDNSFQTRYPEIPDGQDFQFSASHQSQKNIVGVRNQMQPFDPRFSLPTNVQRFYRRKRENKSALEIHYLENNVPMTVICNWATIGELQSSTIRIQNRSTLGTHVLITNSGILQAFGLIESDGEQFKEQETCYFDAKIQFTVICEDKNGMVVSKHPFIVQILKCDDLEEIVDETEYFLGEGITRKRLLLRDK